MSPLGLPKCSAGAARAEFRTVAKRKSFRKILFCILLEQSVDGLDDLIRHKVEIGSSAMLFHTTAPCMPPRRWPRFIPMLMVTSSAIVAEAVSLKLTPRVRAILIAFIQSGAVIYFQLETSFCDRFAVLMYRHRLHDLILPIGKMVRAWHRPCCIEASLEAEEDDYSINNA